ncbi:hypothetical protein HKD37_01G000701 [Glycine soja]
MATPPSSPPPPPPTSVALQPVGAKRPLVHVDPMTGKADGPHNKKLKTYLGIVARDKLNVTYKNWKQVSATQKDMIWEDIQAEFDIPETSDQRTKKKIHQIMGERWRQFKSDLTLKWAIAVDKESVDDTKKAQAIQKQNITLHVLSRGGFIGGAGVTGFLCRPWTSGCTDCCHWATRTPQSCVCCWSRCDDQAILWTCSMNLPHFFLHGSRRHRAADSTNQGPAGGVDHKKMQSQFQSQMQSHGLVLPPEPEVCPLAARVSTNESYVDPLGNDPDTGVWKQCFPRQKGSTECGYYVMHWMSTIILGSFKNNWETYFNDARPVELERLKALRIQWAKYYLKVRNET